MKINLPHPNIFFTLQFQLMCIVWCCGDDPKMDDPETRFVEIGTTGEEAEENSIAISPGEGNIREMKNNETVLWGREGEVEE